MYINPFWVGVIVTIVVEFAVFLLAALIVAGKENNK